jgi:hypothetical protein
MKMIAFIQEMNKQIELTTYVKITFFQEGIYPLCKNLLIVEFRFAV